MSKFKVGDRVIGNASASVYGVTKPGWIGTVVSLDGERMNVYGPGASTEKGFSVLQARFDLVPQKIVVTTDGVTTTARLFAGKQMVKSAEAKCSPSDTFDFGTGAALALDRLLGRDKKAEPEAPKFPREKLQTGVFGRLNDGKWFVVVKDRLLYVRPDSKLEGFDYVRDVNEEGSLGYAGLALDCLTEALSFNHARSKARKREHLIWSRPGAKFD